MMALKPVGDALTRLGSKAINNPKAVQAIVYALRDHPAVKAAIQNGTSDGSGSDASN